jgi:hypothetical protein
VGTGVRGRVAIRRWTANRAARSRPHPARDRFTSTSKEHAQLLADVGRVQRRQFGPLRQLVVAGALGQLGYTVERRQQALDVGSMFCGMSPLPAATWSPSLSFS